MPFVRQEGVTGLVYVPDKTLCDNKKNPCNDCFWCRFCTDEKCAGCLKNKQDKNYRSSIIK